MLVAGDDGELFPAEEWRPDGEFDAVDVFGGPGGWDVPARRRGLRVLGIEFDPDTVATRRAAGLSTMHADVSRVDPELFAGTRGMIGGPPCPSFSSAGLKLGRHDTPHVMACARELAAGRDTRRVHRAACLDARSILTVEPLRWALAMRPEWIVCEQVPAVLPLWELMEELLRTNGWRSTWTGVLRAEEFGVPQTRERAFLLAHTSRIVLPPSATHRRFGGGHELPECVSMVEASGGAWSPEQRVGFPRRNDREDGGAYRTRDTRAASEPAFALTEKARSWRRWSPGEQIGPRTGAPVSVEEAAALQTFPAGFPWQGSRSSRFLQIGNAVPPRLAEMMLAAVGAFDGLQIRRVA
jgi:DNA (cytosine-5)-methyltransferase 1